MQKPKTLDQSPITTSQINDDEAFWDQLNKKIDLKPWIDPMPQTELPFAAPEESNSPPVPEPTMTRLIHMHKQATKLQALRSFDLDLQSITFLQNAPDALDWTLLLFHLDSGNVSNWNEVCLRSLLCNQFAVARAWAEIQLLHRMPIMLLDVWYGDESRHVFIELVRSFAQDTLICNGIKYISQTSLLALNLHRNDQVQWFSNTNRTTNPGTHRDTPSFQVNYNQERTQQAQFLPAFEPSYKNRRLLFAQLMCSACDRHFSIPQTSAQYELVDILPRELYNYVVKATMMIAQRKRREMYDVMNLLLEHTQLVYLVMFVHLSALQYARSLAIQGVSMKPYILDRISILIDFAWTVLSKAM